MENTAHAVFTIFLLREEHSSFFMGELTRTRRDLIAESREQILLKIAIPTSITNFLISHDTWRKDMLGNLTNQSDLLRRPSHSCQFPSRVFVTRGVNFSSIRDFTVKISLDSRQSLVQIYRRDLIRFSSASLQDLGNGMLSAPRHKKTSSSSRREDSGKKKSDKISCEKNSSKFREKKI